MSKVENLAFVGGNVPADLAEELKTLAKAHDRPVAAELRRAIRRHLDAETASSQRKGRAS